MRYLIALVLTIFSFSAYAGDPAAWGSYPPEIHAWFPTVMQPGSRASCCGEADAFEGMADGDDQWGNIRVVIPNGKVIIPDGTVVFAPHSKIQVKYGNPLGILIVFISLADHQTVICLVPAIQG